MKIAVILVQYKANKQPFGWETVDITGQSNWLQYVNSYIQNLKDNLSMKGEDINQLEFSYFVADENQFTPI